MKKICFVTGTRADYGIMSRLMKRLRESHGTQLQIIATNMHLSPEYGMTVNEIEADGFHVDCRVDSLLSGDSPAATVKSMGLTQIGMADAFTQLQPDLVVILGDRYEMLAAASSALIFRIPIAHLYGGETTEGAYDDSIRHAITQLSDYHFTSTPQYAERIISMGKDSSRVFWVGSLGVDNIRSSPSMTLDELEKSLDFKLGNKFVVATFHPVTTIPGEEERQTSALLSALESIIAEDWKILFTMPNSDTGGKKVAALIKDWSERHADNVKAVQSLGRLRYFSALSHAAAVVGNSSSGLIEAPSFGIPTLNIGDRQKGRARGTSVFDVAAEKNDIIRGLHTVLSPEFRMLAADSDNPYAKTDTLQEIYSILVNVVKNSK
ncbi:MAG: UDP-N-acetylglucosamine 2-epimerase (hydrolyzing) [Bacteroides sp.]|nr:UDP-N-acetylglucosamine 2-epimerase (hydrolyzing) [Bacteroides sp.]